ncbi:hypothetical protein EV421DRAFT_1918182 [Armillaria borealis]|uniref:Uncharacterized protein n=1 Tax=Armillaria borealis TaxID=47425 RepID=A0AA39LYX6_9AGAR|nr:hypothetical protein EV421DRAFT_1918182 [Armillaria borealis]
MVTLLSETSEVLLLTTSLSLADQREESSREYEHAANAVDSAKTFDVEGSATESPPLATLETASWEAQRRELDMERAVQVMDDVDEVWSIANQPVVSSRLAAVVKPPMDISADALTDQIS